MSHKPVNHTCEQFKALLVDHGHEALPEHADLAAHVETCAACQRLLRAWTEIPELIEELPEHQPAEALVEQVRKAATDTPSPAQSRLKRRLLAPSLASAAILLAAAGISHQLLMRESPKLPSPDFPQATGQSIRQPGDDKGAADAPVSGPTDIRNMELRPEDERLAAGKSEFSIAGRKQKENAPVDALSSISDSSLAAEPTYESEELETGSPGLAGLQASPEAEMTPDEGYRFADRDGEEGAREVDNATRNEFGQRRALEQHAQLEEDVIRGREAGDYASAQAPSEPAASPPSAVRTETELAKNDLTGADPSDLSNYRSADRFDGRAREPEPHRQVGGVLDETGAGAFTEENKEITLQSSAEGIVTASGLTPELDFLAYYQRTSGLTFQPATGYWANTYVPGDPQIRLLEARLAEWDRSWLPNPALERSVQTIAQPFDAPDNHALALSLMADAAALPADGEATRFRVQVGIQGIEHRRGTRPAMNLAMVVDLPSDAPDSMRISANALLDALLASKQAGDRFALVLTGQPGFRPGLVVTPEDFRFGSLRLAKQTINALDGEAPTVPVQPQDLAAHRELINPLEALQHATELIRARDDGGQEGAQDDANPIGSSSLLLLSGRELSDIESLTSLAHANARDGITMSVVPLGNGASNAQAEQLVLAGLGQRRYLEAPAAARGLIENELHASSQAVARAARLSIRLAPGVQLVDVIGSNRLDTHRAQRVREIENAMDRRLEQNLGIQADRGEDEEGIQIVIPSIFSGDALTVLLDVVAEEPGPVAEVTLRYKDLVYRRNGTLHGQLELPRGTRQQAEVSSDLRQPSRGAAEYSVLKNLLAFHFSASVVSAAESLGNGMPEEALETLREIYETYESVRQSLPALNDDPDLIRDQQVLERYMEALRTPGAQENAGQLADSMRMAAWTKTHGQPETWK